MMENRQGCRDWRRLLLPVLCLLVLDVFGISDNPPTISSIPDQTIVQDSDTGPLAFKINDAETPPDSLVLTVDSSNTQLVPLANIVLGGRGTDRTVTVTPVKGGTGRVLITIT